MEVDMPALEPAPAAAPAPGRGLRRARSDSDDDGAASVSSTAAANAAVAASLARASSPSESMLSLQPGGDDDAPPAAAAAAASAAGDAAAQPGPVGDVAPRKMPMGGEMPGLLLANPGKTYYWMHTSRMSGYTHDRLEKLLTRTGNRAPPMVLFVPYYVLGGKTLGVFSATNPLASTYKALFAYHQAHSVRGGTLMTIAPVLEAPPGGTRTARRRLIGLYVFSYPRASAASAAAAGHLPPPPPASEPAAARGGGAAGLAAPRPRVYTDRMTVADWDKRRLMRAAFTGIESLVELIMPLVALPTLRRPARAAMQPKPCATRLAPEQADEWTALRLFGRIDSIRAMRRVGAGDGGSANANAAGGGGADDDDEDGGGGGGRQRSADVNIASDLFDARIAARSCARTRLAITARSTGTRVVDRRVVDDAANVEWRAMHAHDSLVAHAPDACVTHYIEQFLSHPAAMRRFCVPHLTPPIDEQSPMFIDAFTDKQNEPGMSTENGRPSSAFRAYYVRTRGLTTLFAENGHLEDVIEAYRAVAKRGPRDPVTAARAMNDTCHALNDLLLHAPPDRISVGQETLARTLRESEARRTSLVDLLGGLRFGTLDASLAGSMTRTFLEATGLGLNLVCLHAQAYILYLLGCMSAYDPIDGDVLQPRAVMPGNPGGGKTFVVKNILSKLCTSFSSQATQSAKADTNDRKERGRNVFRDESDPVRFGLDESMSSTYAIRAALKSSTEVRRSRNAESANLLASTATEPRQRHTHLDMVDDEDGSGARSRREKETDTFKFVGEFDTMNWTWAIASLRMTRRYFALEILQTSAQGGRTALTAARVSGDAQREMQITLDRWSGCTRALHTATNLVYLAVATGHAVVDTTPLVTVLDIAAEGPEREPGPQLKARTLTTALTTQSALLCLAHRIGAPSPLETLSVADAQYAKPFLCAGPEQVAGAIDVIYGRITNQVARPGLHVVHEGLRRMFSLSGTDWADDRQLVLERAPAGLFPGSERYARLRNALIVAPRADELEIALARHINRLTIAKALEQTLVACVISLTVSTEIVELSPGRSVEMPVLRFGTRAPYVPSEQRQQRGDGGGGAPWQQQQQQAVAARSDDQGTLYVMIDWLLRPPVQADARILNLGFPPGVRALWNRRRILVDWAEPSCALIQRRTRHCVAAEIHRFVNRRAVQTTAASFARYKLAIDAALVIGARFCAGLTEPGTRHAATLNLMRALEAEASRAGAGNAFVLVHVGIAFHHAVCTALVAAGDANAGGQIAASLSARSELRDALTAVYTAFEAYQAAMWDEAALSADCVARAVTYWFERPIFAPSHCANMDQVSGLVDAGFARPSAMRAFTDDADEWPDAALFDRAAENHLRNQCGVRAYLVRYHVAHPANRSVLEHCAQRVNDCVARVRRTVDALLTRTAVARRFIVRRTGVAALPDASQYGDAQLDGIAAAAAAADDPAADAAAAPLGPEARAALAGRAAALACRRLEEEHLAAAAGGAANVPTTTELRALRVAVCDAVAALAVQEAAFVFRLRSVLGGMNYTPTVALYKHLLGARDAAGAGGTGVPPLQSGAPSHWDVVVSASDPAHRLDQFTVEAVAQFVYAVVMRVAYDRRGTPAPLDPDATAFDPRSPLFGARVYTAELRATGDTAVADALERDGCLEWATDDADAFARDPTARFDPERLFAPRSADAPAPEYAAPRDPLGDAALRARIDTVLAPPELPEDPLRPADVESFASVLLVCPPNAWQDVAGHAEHAVYNEERAAFRAATAAYRRELRAYNAAQAAIPEDGADDDARAAAPVPPPPLGPPPEVPVSGAALARFYRPVLKRTRCVLATTAALAACVAPVLAEQLVWISPHAAAGASEAARRDLLGVVAAADGTARRRAIGHLAVSLAIQAGYAASVPRVEAWLDERLTNERYQWRAPPAAPLDPCRDEIPYVAAVMSGGPTIAACDALLSATRVAMANVAPARAAPAAAAAAAAEAPGEREPPAVAPVAVGGGGGGGGEDSSGADTNSRPEGDTAAAAAGAAAAAAAGAGDDDDDGIEALGASLEVPPRGDTAHMLGDAPMPDPGAVPRVYENLIISDDACAGIGDALHSMALGADDQSRAAAADFARNAIPPPPPQSPQRHREPKRARVTLP